MVDPSVQDRATQDRLHRLCRRYIRVAFFYLALGLDWLQRELGKIRLQEGARLTVVDNRGMVIVRFPDPEEWTGKNVAHFPLVQRFLAAEHGDGILEETGLDGVRKLIAHARLLTTASGGSFHLWTTVPKQVVEAPAQREALIELGIMLTVLIEPPPVGNVCGPEIFVTVFCR